MFTGLVAATGRLASLREGRLAIELDQPLDLIDGDSISVSGVCLTAAEVRERGFDADVMAETLRRTALGELRAGDPVNLEPALRASDRLGGHIVQGHVDGTGVIESVTAEGFARLVRIEAPPELLRYVVGKGSIAVDGVSLTVAEVDDEWFSVGLIPETLERTTFAAATVGRRVNLEVDVLAKYVEKLLSQTVEAP
jgi:riboflavin synthase